MLYFHPLEIIKGNVVYSCIFITNMLVFGLHIHSGFFNLYLFANYCLNHKIL